MMKRNYGHVNKFKSIKAILFDVDGTLFSSEGIIEQIYRMEFQKHNQKYGKPEVIPGHDAIMAQIGKPVVKIFEALAPDLALTEREKLSEIILGELVSAIMNGAGEHYEGVKETIESLSKNFKIIAASNGRLPYVEAILKANDVDSFFKAIPFVDNIRIKNKSELVKSILEEFHLRPDETVLVGDRTSDRDAALENGCYFIACRYGHGSEEEWKGAHAYIDSIKDLLKYFD